jgi:membrane fusion protein, multidrug efflux system
MQRKRIIAILVVAIAAIGFSIYAINGTKGSTKSAKLSAGGPPGSGDTTQSEAKAVKAKAAALKTLHPYIDEGGDVQASINVSVYPDIGGKLAGLKVAVGDSVVKGAAIASVDPSKPGSNYAISAVTAPITGTVTSVLAELGETVSTSTSIATVGVIDDLEIVLNLPERDSAKAQKGMSATVSLEAIPSETFAATVARVSPVLDAASRTREVTLKLSKPDDRVAAGMYATVRLFTTPLERRIVVPSDAVTTRNDETFVYAVTDVDGKKTAKKLVVSTGTSVDDEIEITKGVVANDLIVYEGQDLLSDGSEVSVVNEGGK